MCLLQAANAGGVAVSGLEMSQNAMRLQWTSEEVDNKLKVASAHLTCTSKKCFLLFNQIHSKLFLKTNIVALLSSTQFQAIAVQFSSLQVQYIVCQLTALHLLHVTSHIT